MGLLSWIFGKSTDDDSNSEAELDPSLLLPLAKEWLSQAVTSDDDDVNEYRWSAVEHAEEETSQGLFDWLLGG